MSANSLGSIAMGWKPPSDGPRATAIKARLSLSGRTNRVKALPSHVSSVLRMGDTLAPKRENPMRNFDIPAQGMTKRQYFELCMMMDPEVLRISIANPSQMMIDRPIYIKLQRLALRKMET